MLVGIHRETGGLGFSPERELARSINSGFGVPQGSAKLPPLVAFNLKGWRGLEQRSITLALASVAPR